MGAIAKEEDATPKNASVFPIRRYAILTNVATALIKRPKLSFARITLINQSIAKTFKSR